MTHTHRYAFASFVLCVAVLVACKPSAPPAAEEPAAASRVEYPDLGLAIANVPEIFRISNADDSGIELELVEGEGVLRITPGEVERSINLVQAVKDHQADILARPGGDYKGGNELVLVEFPGAAYYSRGRFEGEAGPTEETVMFLIHPWKDRQVRVTYIYPAGDDSSARLQDQLFALVQELEGMPVPEADAEPSEG